MTASEYIRKADLTGLNAVVVHRKLGWRVRCFQQPQEIQAGEICMTSMARDISFQFSSPSEALHQARQSAVSLKTEAILLDGVELAAAREVEQSLRIMEQCILDNPQS